MRAFQKWEAKNSNQFLFFIKYKTREKKRSVIQFLLKLYQPIQVSLQLMTSLRERLLLNALLTEPWKMNQFVEYYKIIIHNLVSHLKKCL